MPGKSMISPTSLIFVNFHKFTKNHIIKFHWIHKLIGFICSNGKKKGKEYTSKSSAVDLVLMEIYLCHHKNSKHFAETISVKNEN